MVDAKRAVEVLEEAVALADGYAVELGLVEAQKLAIAALKAQGEPVAWMVRSYEKGVECIDLHYSEEEAQEAAECMPLSLPKVIALYTASQPESGEWIKADDVNRLTRELDVLLNGEDGAAAQASLCDIVGQVRAQGLTIRCVSTNAQAEPLEALDHLLDLVWRGGFEGNGKSSAETLRRFIESQQLGICATILKIMESEPLRHWTFLDVALRLKGKSSQSVIEAMRELLTHGVIEAQNQHGTPSFRVRRNAGAAA